jgi:[histone H3]-lysine36 N-trimethyltransferase
VQDPHKVAKKQERNVKMYMKEYLDKAVEKHREHEKRKREKETTKQTNGVHMKTIPVSPVRQDESLLDDDIQLSDIEEDTVVRKRKDLDEEDESSSKRAKTEDAPPPPPPPPPTDDTGVNVEDGYVELQDEEGLNILAPRPVVRGVDGT